MQLIKHSVRLFGHATSLTLEQEFWDYLHELSIKHHVTIRALLEECDKNSFIDANFSSHIRSQLLRKALGKDSAFDNIISSSVHESM